MKAQIVGRIFIYILALVIMSLVLIYGYTSIKGLLETAEDINLLDTKNAIKDAVEGISYQRDTVREKSIQVPTRFERVCFIDKEYDYHDSTQICDGDTDDYPLICDSWGKTSDNVFFVESKTKIEPFYAGEIVVDGNGDGKEDISPDCTSSSCYNLCLNITRSRVNFWLKGLGDKTLISEEPS